MGIRWPWVKTPAPEPEIEEPEVLPSLYVEFLEKAQKTHQDGSVWFLLGHRWPVKEVSVISFTDDKVEYSFLCTHTLKRITCTTRPYYGFSLELFEVPQSRWESWQKAHGGICAWIKRRLDEKHPATAIDLSNGRLDLELHGNFLQLLIETNRSGEKEIVVGGLNYGRSEVKLLPWLLHDIAMSSEEFLELLLAAEAADTERTKVRYLQCSRKNPFAEHVGRFVCQVPIDPFEAVTNNKDQYDRFRIDAVIPPEQQHVHATYECQYLPDLILNDRHGQKRLAFSGDFIFHRDPTDRKGV